MDTNQLVTRLFTDEIAVSFTQDAWVNATVVASEFNKKTHDWLRLDSTKEYIEALCRKGSPVTGNPVTEQNQWVIVVQGGIPEEQGTWIHPKLAMMFARWLSADFAVWCDEQIDQLLRPQYTEATQSLIEAGVKAELQRLETAAHKARISTIPVEPLPDTKRRGMTEQMWAAINAEMRDIAAECEDPSATLNGIETHFYKHFTGDIQYSLAIEYLDRIRNACENGYSFAYNKGSIRLDSRFT